MYIYAILHRIHIFLTRACFLTMIPNRHHSFNIVLNVCSWQCPRAKSLFSQILSLTSQCKETGSLCILYKVNIHETSWCSKGSGLIL